MPPKAPAVRGRGRGRGRGGASGSTRPATAQENGSADQPTQETAATQTVVASDSNRAGAAPAPVAQMTASPAPSTSAGSRPLQRLDSLRKPASSASPAPPTRGKKAVVAAPKFVGRRSKEDRAALEAAANAKRAEEMRNALREAKKAGRGRDRPDRGRGGKARGGFMGDSERRIRENVASGPFSAGTVTAEGSYGGRRTGPSMGAFGGAGGGGGGGAGGGRGYGGGTRIKSEGGSYGGSHAGTGAPEDGGYISSDADEGEEGPRKNIDYIDLASDDEDNARAGRAASTFSSLAPIRVSRVEHREREKPVSTDVKSKQSIETAQAPDGTETTVEGEVATTATARTPSPVALRKGKGKQRAKDVEVVRTERKWKGAWEDSEDSDVEVQVKPEPTEDASEITAEPVDIADIPIKESSSPESKRKSKPRPRRHALPDEAPEHQTLEEKREWERHHMDLEILRQELGEIVLPPPAPAPAAEPAPDAQGDTEMADAGSPAAAPPAEAAPAQDVPVDRRTDRVYLFQFPPVLPDLYATAAVKTEPPQSPDLARKDKANPTAAPLSLDDIPPSTSNPEQAKAGAANASSSSSSNTKDAPVKVEDDAPSYSNSGHVQPSGRVGKLRVHASGRTTLDWGGTSLQIGMGTDVQFLQDVIVARMFEREAKEGADRDKDRADASKEPGGEVMGLGQVRGKFVVTPDWEEIVGQRI
ncbi:hypothetical protein MBLNU459_g1600t1 [Dothideomycetes sp. NU459]